jgi:hypothetical protein
MERYNIPVEDVAQMGSMHWIWKQASYGGSTMELCDSDVPILVQLGALLLELHGKVLPPPFE